MNKTENEKGKKLQFGIDVVLTAFFLITIFFFGIMTVKEFHVEIINNAKSKTRLSAYVEDINTATTWEKLCASIRSVDSLLNSSIYLGDEIGYINSTFQYALGKDLIATGASKMVTLNSGHLYDLQNYVPMQVCDGVYHPCTGKRSAARTCV